MAISHAKYSHFDPHPVHGLSRISTQACRHPSREGRPEVMYSLTIDCRDPHTSLSMHLRRWELEALHETIGDLLEETADLDPVEEPDEDLECRACGGTGAVAS